MYTSKRINSNEILNKIKAEILLYSNNTFAFENEAREKFRESIGILESNIEKYENLARAQLDPNEAPLRPYEKKAL
jgi:hypothetical protein